VSPAPPHPPLPALALATAAIWGGQTPAPRSNRANRRVVARLKKWTLHTSGSLLGFRSVELASTDHDDLRLMAGKNGHWIAMPAVKQLDRDGAPRLDAKDKPIFNQLVEFRGRTTSDKFNALVLALIRAKHPGAFDDGDVP
jgi:hypothetical protein